MTTTNRPVAVVTGASSGIGYELARQFAEHGYDLVIGAEDGGIARAAQDIQALGANVEPVQADLATWDGVEKLWNTATAGGRHPDRAAARLRSGGGSRRPAGRAPGRRPTPGRRPPR